MSQEQPDQGKQWVSETLAKFADSSGLSIEHLEWHSDADDARGFTESLLIESGGQRFIERFRLAQLEDVPGDSGVRNGLERYLKQLIGRISVRQGDRENRGR